jgi:hypothetical protein
MRCTLCRGHFTHPRGLNTYTATISPFFLLALADLYLMHFRLRLFQLLLLFSTKATQTSE